MKYVVFILSSIDSVVGIVRDDYFLAWITCFAVMLFCLNCIIKGEEENEEN